MDVRSRTLAILLLGTIVGCAPSSENLEKELSAANRSKIEAGVREALENPISPNIVVKEVFSLFDGTVACGVVNEKNISGDFTGYRAFTIGINADGNATEANIASNEVSSELLSAMCSIEKAYAAVPGNSGNPATSEQRNQLFSIYEREAMEVIERIASER